MSSTHLNEESGNKHAQQPVSKMSKEMLNSMELILLKSIDSKSYDDLLFLRMYLSKTEFIKRNLPDITAKQTDDLCRSLIFETYEEGDVVFTQGQHADKVYIILSGTVDITMKYTVDLGNGDLESREKFIRTMYDGQYFGERALNYDEPRSATATCTSITHLISINKEIYLSIQNNDANTFDSLKVIQPGTKEYVIDVLSKARHQRTNEDISIVATYLDRRVPFFQKFTSEQRIELCRVVDIVSIYGRSVLFKQGSIGQAFYIVLTGSVEIWVNSQDRSTSVQPIDTSNLVIDVNSSTKKQSHIFDGLGERVNQLGPGDVFGERALENASSVRMGSVVTCDDFTDLIVVSKEDYINLVSFMMHSDIMEKIVVLRKTPLFQNVEGVHLKSLARYMFMRQSRLDETICKVGDKMNDIIVIAAGELKASIDVEPIVPIHAIKSSTLYLKNSTKQDYNLGRIAPFSVLGTNLMLLESVLDEIYHKETVTATTFVKYYVIAKTDFLVHLALESRIALANAVRQFVNPLLPQLWENTPKHITETDWKIDLAWNQFKNDIKNHKNTSLLKHYKAIEDVHLKARPITPKMMKSNHNFNNLSNNRLTFSSSLQKDSTNVIVSSDWGTPAAIAREKEYRKGTTFNSLLSNTSSSKLKTTYHKEGFRFEDNPSVLKAIEIGSKRDKKKVDFLGGNDSMSEELKLPPISSLQSNSYDSNDKVKKNNVQLNSLEQHPFALIQYHREPVRLRDSSNVNHSNYSYNSGNISLKHMVRCHMRLCGTVSSCHATKELAMAIMKNVYLTLYNSDLTKENEISLTWHVFNGFESIPLQNSDHFIIYCKNTPVEYASITPSKNLLSHDFPATCKSKNQRFACVLAKEISNMSLKRIPTSVSTNTNNSNNQSNNNVDSTINHKRTPKPLFIAEISAVIEICAAFLTQIDCLRFCVIDDDTKLLNNNNQIPMNKSYNNILDNQNIRQRRIHLSNHMTQYTIMNPNSKLLLCVFPLYEWIVIDQESLDMSSVYNTIDYSKSDNLINVKLTKHLSNNDINNELQISLKESGLLSNSPLNRNQKSDKNSLEKNLIAPNISIKLLEKEVYRKELLKQVNKYINTNNLIDNKNNNITDKLIDNNIKDINQPLNTEDELENLLLKLQAMKQLIIERQKILDSNNDLCNKEISLHSLFSYYRKNSLPIQQILYTNATSANTASNLNNVLKMNMYELRQTIENSTKNSNIYQLEKEISDGLGLVLERESMHEILLKAPNIKEIINDIIINNKKNIINNNINISKNNNNKPIVQIELINKLVALQSILEKVHESNEGINNTITQSQKLNI